MKQISGIFFICAAFLTALLSYGCSELPDPLDRSIDVQIMTFSEGVVIDDSDDIPVVTVPSTGGTFTAVVQSSVTWNAVPTAIVTDSEGNESESATVQWLRTQGLDDLLTVTIDGYFDETGEDVENMQRRGYVRLQIGNDPRSRIFIRQGAEIKATVDIGTDFIYLPSDGTTTKLKVTTNQPTFTAELVGDGSGDTADWLTLDTSTEPGYLIINSSANTDSGERTATMSLSAGTAPNVVSKTVYISQLNGSLILIYNTEEDGATIALPICGVVDAGVSWGDDSTDAINKTINPSEGSEYITHTFAAKGRYKVAISGSVERLCSSGMSEEQKARLTGVEQWGNVGLKSLEEAFAGTAISTLPTMKDLSFVNVTNLNSMFRDCKSLSSVPADIFSQCGSIQEFTSVFEGCAKLGSVSALFANCTAVVSFTRTFANCVALRSVSEYLFETNINATSFNETFFGCEYLVSMSNKLFAKNAKAVSFNGTFEQCISLKTVPQGMFDGNVNVTSFNATFKGCTNLESVYELTFSKCTKVTDFTDVFNGCVKLSGKSPYAIGSDKKSVKLYMRKDYPDQFATPTDYSGAFRDCTNLDDFETIENDFSGWL